MGTFLLGLAIGAVIGAAGAYLALRRSTAPPAASVAPEPALAAPVTAPPAPAAAPPPPEAPAVKTDDDVQQALDATRGLLDELEGRYRDRPPPPDDEETGAPKPRRRPRPKS